MPLCRPSDPELPDPGCTRARPCVSAPDAPALDGVVIEQQSVPGGDNPDYTGGTAAHECVQATHTRLLRASCFFTETLLTSVSPSLGALAR